MSKINTLVFPCGSQIAIEIHTALKYAVNIKLFGSSSREDHGRFLFKNYIGGLPYIEDDNFLERLNLIIKKYNIDIIFPTHDSVSLFFAENIEKISCKVAVPDKKTAKICRNKRLIYDIFKDKDFNPKVYKHNDIIEYPVFIKPNMGEGGKNTYLVRTERDLQKFNFNKKDLLIVEYLPGDELTIDCFTDRYEKLRFIGPRQRQRIWGGISVRARPVKLTEEIKNIAEIINSKLSLRGLWFFQVKKDTKGKYKLMEISIRTAGTMTLYRNLGINFPLLTVYDLMNKDIEIIKNNYDILLERALIDRYSLDYYYNTVYLDFDDTLTFEGKLNPFIMAFLYQLVNKNKNIILLTRHESNIYQTLKDLRVDVNIFDKICTIGKDEEKYDYIKNKETAIFIDNAYKERKKVKEKRNIPVFDVDAVQSLIDWKE